jgi:hypothetical protein
MEEIVKTHLPLLAWRWQEGRYRLIYDDVPVGEVAIDPEGYSAVRYHDIHWTIEPTRQGAAALRVLGESEPAGGLERSAAGKQANGESGPEEGRITLNDRRYRYLRDARKIPPRLTLTGEANQPLLQFREEDEDHGRIQIDDQTAAASPDFEILVLWGLQLYLSASSTLRRTPLKRQKPSIRRKPVTDPSEPESGNPPPVPPAADQSGGDDGGGEGKVWLAALAGLALALWIQSVRKGMSAKK